MADRKVLILAPEMGHSDPAPDPLAPIRARFLTMVEEQAIDVAMLRHAAANPAGQVESVKGIGQIAHRVSGVAATLGFQDLGRLAAVLDQQISLALKSGTVAMRDIDDMIQLFQAELHHAMSKSAT